MTGTRALGLSVLLLVGACTNTDGKLKDLSWGTEIQGDYEDVKDRALFVLRKEFPKGFDPERTDEDAGEFWTVWHYKVSTWYRETTRSRARVKIEDLGDGKVRVGVAIVEQLNDNIDNPSIIEEARWVNTHRNGEREKLVESRISQRYLKLEPSEYWKEKHRDKPRAGLRQDLIDRNKDVNLEEYGKIDPKRELPSMTKPESEKKK